MDSDKKFYGIVLGLVVLLGISVFFLFNYLSNSDSSETNTPNTPGTQEPDDVSVADEVSTFNVSITNRGEAVKAADGSYTVSYRVAIQNTSQYPVTSITARNNLAARFAPHTIEILEKSASNLTINNRFNGTSNIDLLFGADTLDPAESGYIDVTFRLIPTSPIQSLAEFENGVVVDGDIVGPNNNNDGGDNGGTGNDGSGGGDNNGGNNNDDDPVDNWTPEDDLTPREFTFELVNVDTGEVIRTIQPGENIDLADLPTDNVTVRGVPGIGTRGSVIFDYNGTPDYRVEGTAPYSISGNPTSSTYGPWNYALGDQDITIRAFTGRDGEGDQIGESNISFSFSDSRTSAVGGDNYGEGDPDTSGSAVINVNIPGTEPDEETAGENGEEENPTPTPTPTTPNNNGQTPTGGVGSGNGTTGNNTGNTNNTGGTPRPNTLPSTGIIDDNLFALFGGFALVILGMIVYQTNYFSRSLNKLFANHFSSDSEDEGNRLRF